MMKNSYEPRSRKLLVTALASPFLEGRTEAGPFPQRLPKPRAESYQGAKVTTSASLKL